MCSVCATTYICTINRESYTFVVYVNIALDFIHARKCNTYAELRRDQRTENNKIIKKKEKEEEEEEEVVLSPCNLGLNEW